MSEERLSMHHSRIVTVLLLAAPDSDASMTLLDLLGKRGSVGAAVRVATDAQNVMTSFNQGNHVHVLVIDAIEVPSCHTMDLIKQIKLKQSLGVIVLVKSSKERANISAAGADLCIEFPKDKEKLSAHAKNLLEFYSSRVCSSVSKPDICSSEGLVTRLDIDDSSSEIIPWTLDENRSLLLMPNGEMVALIATECIFLDMIFKSKDRCLRWGAA